MCLVSGAGTHKRQGAFPEICCFGLFLPFQAHRWFGSSLDFTHITMMGILRASGVISMLMGMGLPNPVGILEHRPEVRGQLDSEETSFF